MTYAELKTFIGDKTNDPNHDRYTVSQIATELDAVMDEWNVEAKLIKSTTTITVVSGTRQYLLSGISGTVIAIPRATHKGIPITKRDKAYIDLYYGGSDWTAHQGTPTDYYLDVSDPTGQYVVVYPTPQDNDAGANLVLEAIIRHTSMSSDSDVPFMVGSSSNPELRPYDVGIGYQVAARFLASDPSKENVPRMTNYASIGNGVKANLVQVYKALEKQEPPHLKMPMRWRRR